MIRVDFLDEPCAQLALHGVVLSEEVVWALRRASGKGGQLLAEPVLVQVEGGSVLEQGVAGLDRPHEKA